MRARVATVALEYGKGSDEHVAMAESLLDALVSMIGLGGRVMRSGREDELCLIGVTVGDFTYGVDFLPKRDGDQRDQLRGEWYVHS
jgi:hypothetical protein